MSTETLPLAAPLRKLLVPLAAHGLAGSVVEMPDRPFAADEWFGLVGMCQENGLLGMLAAAAQSGAVTLSTAQAEELDLRESEAAAVALLVEQRVVRLSALLTAAGIEHRLVGAAARARLGYRQPGIRLFEIATLLVEPGDHDLGVPRGVMVRPAVPLASGRTIDVAQLSRPPRLLCLADCQVPTVSIEEHLVLTCIESTAPVRGDLVLQRDIAELALSKGIDSARVQQTAEAWQVGELVAKTLAQVWDRFRLADQTRLSVWARRIVATPASPSSATPAAPCPSHRRRPSRQVRRLLHKARKLTPSRVVTELAARWPSSGRSERR